MPEISEPVAVNGSTVEEQKTESPSETIIEPLEPVKTVPGDVQEPEPAANAVTETESGPDTERVEPEGNSQESSVEPVCELPTKTDNVEEVISCPIPTNKEEAEKEVEIINGDRLSEDKNGAPLPVIQNEPEVTPEPVPTEEKQNVINNSKVYVEKQHEAIEPAANGAPPKKGASLTSVDSKGVKEAYEAVRSDGNDTQWAVFKFEGSQIKCSARGSDFPAFKSQFNDDERAFGYIRVQTGDEMSKRQKFLLLTWVGPSVSVLKRAKMSIDKYVVRSVISNFAVELQTENISEVNIEYFIDLLNKAGGANYGTGIRES